MSAKKFPIVGIFDPFGVAWRVCGAYTEGTRQTTQEAAVVATQITKERMLELVYEEMREARKERDEALRDGNQQEALHCSGMMQGLRLLRRRLEKEFA